MSFTPREYLLHIRSETQYLMERGREVSAEAFRRDETLQRAFVRSLEIIGEATKKLPEGFRNAHPEVDWRDMARMRDRLIHGYFSVDYELVWEVVQTRVPELDRSIARLLDTAADPTNENGEPQG